MRPGKSKMQPRSTAGASRRPSCLPNSSAKVAQLFEQRGKTVMAWADIVVKYPAIIDRLPRRLIPVAWAYEAQPDVKKWLDPLVARRLPHFIQSGVANWKEIALDFDLTFANIDNFLAAGRKSGTMGMINSVWTDSAQGFLRLTLPAMAYGTIAPWQSAVVDRADFFRQYAALMYSPAVAPDVAATLDNLNKAEVSIHKALGQASIHAMWDDPFSAASLKQSADHREDLRQTRLMAEQAQTHVYRALEAGGDTGTLNSLLLGGGMLDFAAYKFLNALEIAERWRSFGSYDSNRYWNGVRIRRRVPVARPLRGHDGCRFRIASCVPVGLARGVYALPHGRGAGTLGRGVSILAAAAEPLPQCHPGPEGRRISAAVRIHHRPGVSAILCTKYIRFLACGESRPRAAATLPRSVCGRRCNRAGPAPEWHGSNLSSSSRSNQRVTKFGDSGRSITFRVLYCFFVIEP